MRRFAAGREMALAFALTASALALFGSACAHEKHPMLASDCSGASGGPKPIHGTPHQSDIPTQWGDPSQAVPLGHNGVRLRIRPVLHVGNFGTDCLTGGAQYIVARIEYEDPTNATPVAEWSSWKDHAQPVYVLITAPTGKGDFDYAILVPQGTDALTPTDSNPRHGFSFPDAKAPKDSATWGAPPTHVRLRAYVARYEAVAGEPVPALPTQDSSQIHRSLDTTSKLDPAQAAWFSCTQGCCTATGVI